MYRSHGPEVAIMQRATPRLIQLVETINKFQDEAPRHRVLQPEAEAFARRCGEALVEFESRGGSLVAPTVRDTYTLLLRYFQPYARHEWDAWCPLLRVTPLQLARRIQHYGACRYNCDLLDLHSAGKISLATHDRLTAEYRDTHILNLDKIPLAHPPVVWPRMAPAPPNQPPLFMGDGSNGEDENDDDAVQAMLGTSAGTNSPVDGAQEPPPDNAGPGEGAPSEERGGYASRGDGGASGEAGGDAGEGAGGDAGEGAGGNAGGNDGDDDDDHDDGRQDEGNGDEDKEEGGPEEGEIVDDGEEEIEVEEDELEDVEEPTGPSKRRRSPTIDLDESNDDEAPPPSKKGKTVERRPPRGRGRPSARSWYPTSLPAGSPGCLWCRLEGRVCVPIGGVSCQGCRASKAVCRWGDWEHDILGNKVRPIGAKAYERIVRYQDLMHRKGLPWPQRVGDQPVAVAKKPQRFAGPILLTQERTSEEPSSDAAGPSCWEYRPDFDMYELADQLQNSATVSRPSLPPIETLPSGPGGALGLTNFPGTVLVPATPYVVTPPPAQPEDVPPPTAIRAGPPLPRRTAPLPASVGPSLSPADPSTVLPAPGPDVVPSSMPSQDVELEMPSHGRVGPPPAVAPAALDVVVLPGPAVVEPPMPPVTEVVPRPSLLYHVDGALLTPGEYGSYTALDLEIQLLARRAAVLAETQAELEARRRQLLEAARACHP
ncbi:hypothetical protein WOLCODRAFT_157702 [Wolfiporia cocos MD-104 SS10]|uniref:Zn(2)-C6 fungal-type domain-containing protein n=1 Tax=Wolfiporia cocos (strain MD-104) TaxID=742152 RepID=A0A2H3JB14_WOLCO|nr:hypothetical protein WOLCODRAFT_157702 [Wolfiporia cocos MD-104 SS10]